MQAVLNKLSLHFLCGFPVSKLPFPDGALTLEDQRYLLEATVNSPLVLKYPLKVLYQKAFLKRVLDIVKEQAVDIYEDLYCSYARLVTVVESEPTCYKHYRIANSETTISLKENVHLVFQGTTGLQTWQASLALAEWCLNNKTLLFKKNILELGSGIGLTGLAACLECQPNQFYFSDCHPSVLQTLLENIELNCKGLSTSNDTLNDRCAFAGQLHNGVRLSVFNLPWERVDENVCEQIGSVDLVLAADVVYDSGLFAPLIGALKCISVKCLVEEIVFACTERNPATLGKFLREIGECFSIVEQDCPSQRNFIWTDEVPVRVFRFRLLH